MSVFECESVSDLLHIILVLVLGRQARITLVCRMFAEVVMSDRTETRVGTHFSSTWMPRLLLGLVSISRNLSTVWALKSLGF